MSEQIYIFNPEHDLCLANEDENFVPPKSAVGFAKENIDLSGSATLRTPEGLCVVQEGDMIFFESGEKGAHQLFNHTDSECIFLDMRSYIGHDVCEYPDSDKLIIVPDGETEVDEIWKSLSVDDATE